MESESCSSFSLQEPEQGTGVASVLARIVERRKEEVAAIFKTYVLGSESSLFET